jgi:hypothetical protein
MIFRLLSLALFAMVSPNHGPLPAAGALSERLGVLQTFIPDYRLGGVAYLETDDDDSDEKGVRRTGPGAASVPPFPGPPRPAPASRLPGVRAGHPDVVPLIYRYCTLLR